MDPAPRRGRRDNGLDAVAFVPLADVDPRVGEHLLDVLRAAGVPAYLEPSADIEPYTRTLALPSPPTDRLWVDREQRLAARQIVEAEAAAGEAGPDRGPDHQPEERPSAGLPDADEELVWRQIVAGFGVDEKEPPVRPWPVAEDDDRPAGDDPDAAGTGTDADAGRRRRGRRSDADPTDADDLAGEADTAADGGAALVDDEGHYEPPPPPPLPRLSRQAIIGLGLLAVGILLLAFPGLIDLGRRDGMLFGVLAVLSGAGVLVYRLRDSRSDDGPDDGAVV